MRRRIAIGLRRELMSDIRRFALVTGASSGIGMAYAEHLASRGYDLILVARRGDRLEAIAHKIRAQEGRQVVTYVADLSDPDDLLGLERMLRENEDVDVLVNNAGLGALGSTASAGVDALENLVRINVLALTRLSCAALAGFRRRGHGILINIASVIALAPSATAAAYSGSKAYVLNFSRSLQLECAGSGIVVQTVLPGPVRTEFFEASGVCSSIFSEHLFISADELVAAALKALDMKELVCFPTLPDIAAWDEFENARTSFSKSLVTVGRPSPRYAG